MTSPVSLFDRLGGEDAITAAVALFYDKVLADPLVSPFFERLDMDMQVKKQIAFMGYAFGSGLAYSGRGLVEAHAELVRDHGLDDSHFDAIAAHLDETLRELGTPDAEREEALGIVAGTREAVLGRGAEPAENS